MGAFVIEFCAARYTEGDVTYICEKALGHYPHDQWHFGRARQEDGRVMTFSEGTPRIAGWMNEAAKT